MRITIELSIPDTHADLAKNQGQALAAILERAVERIRAYDPVPDGQFVLHDSSGEPLGLVSVSRFPHTHSAIHLEEVAKNKAKLTDSLQKQIREAEGRPEWLDDLSPCTAAAYAAWLRGHLQAGGKITHHYDYDLPSNFFVARHDFVATPLFGSKSVSIVVPDGVNATTRGGLGHNNIFRMTDFSAEGGWIPCYNDTAAMLDHLE